MRAKWIGAVLLILVVIAGLAVWQSGALRQNRYDKFDRPLYERLQTVGEQDLLPVAIWVNGARGRSEEELQQILAARHPEVREALARHETILSLSDPVLIQRVKKEYEQLKQEDIDVRLKPLIAYLESQGVTAQSVGLMPSIAVTLTRSALFAVAEREDVGMIYLIDGVAEPASETTSP